MAHGIEKTDKMFSTLGYSWHRKDVLVETIDEETASPLFFEVIESPLMVNIDGQLVKMEGYKSLVADHRAVRPDLAPEDQLIPLHIPKDGYKVISNREIFSVAEKALKDVDATITSVMTLESGKKFALSVNLGDNVLKVNNDEIHAHLNFVSSHDGTLNMKAYDSTIRIVCMNTLRWSLESAGQVGFNVRHTKNAELALSNLPELIENILKGRVNFKEVMTYLETCKVDSNEALAMAAGYFMIESGASKLSTRAFNSAQGIVSLFSNGLGNHGRSLYDLVNGATQYWTSGDGVGHKADQATKSYKAEFGMAADHKTRFVELLANEDERNRAKEIGAEAVAEALAS
jgi:hypothetical protein